LSFSSLRLYRLDGLLYHKLIDMNKNQNGSVASFAAIFILVLVVLGLAVFAGWAFIGRQDYKNNSDKKVETAVENAKKAQEADLRKQFVEDEKKPNETYKGSTTYGTVTFDYPKTWSGYVDESSSNQPINGYFHPAIVPGLQSKTAYALRVELVNTDYSSIVKQHDSQIKAGTVKASAYIPPKLVGVANVQPGTKLDGALDQDTTGSMVIVKVRDKTLQIYTESNDFLKDFNDTTLASLTFAP